MALIKRLTVAPNLVFMARRNLFLACSAVLVAASVALFLVQGLNFGVDFRGGILIEVKTDGPADIGEMRGLLGGLGLGEVTLQEFGEPDDVLINVQRQEGEEAEQIQAIAVVKEALGERVVEYRRTEFVGPKVGGELKQAGALATGLALLVIGVYIWFRFEWQFSIAALIALLHDVIATIGFYSLTQIEFNLATLAAVLMIAGYSINDTVVIFDRVRENLRKFKKMPLFELLDRSINQTLTRTVLTSVTTLLALFALFFFGGPVIRGFTIGLIWGVCIGTYSSIALAVPLLARFNVRGQTAPGDVGSEDSAPEEDAGEDAGEEPAKAG
jgi:preprotein translocase SecF subunit